MATTIPGGVTSNIVGSTSAYASPQDQAAAYNLQKQKEEDRKRQLDTAFLANVNLGKPARDPRAEADAKMKSAYEKFYAPMAQSQWDLGQGKLGGVPPKNVGGPGGLLATQMRPGYSVYAKPDPWGVKSGAQGYEYKPDTNMPADQYQKQLDQAYEMWKAGQMMGAEDWEVKGYLGTSYGGRGEEGNKAGRSR